MIDTNDVIRIAAAMVGQPYVWGGESEAEGGYDCSGFVYTVLNRVGYTIGRYTAQGFYNRFKKNIISNERAYTEKGALLFFGKSVSNITHIAIAVGDGTMYESIGGRANTKYNKGKGVTLSKVSRRKDLVAVCTIYAEQNLTNFYPKYTGASSKLDVILMNVGAPYGNVSKRKALAEANGILNYTGSLTQNLELIKRAKAGTLRRV